MFVNLYNMFTNLRQGGEIKNYQLPRSPDQISHIRKDILAPSLLVSIFCFMFCFPISKHSYSERSFHCWFTPGWLSGGVVLDAAEVRLPWTHFPGLAGGWVHPKCGNCSGRAGQAAGGEHWTVLRKHKVVAWRARWLDWSAYSWGLRDGLRPGRSLGEGDSSQHLRWTCRSVQSCMSWKPGLVEASSSIRNHAQKCPAGLLGSSRCPWASFWEDQMPGVRPRSMQFLPVSAEWLPTFLRQGSCDAEPLPGPEPHDFPAADFIPILGDFVWHTAQAPEALPEYGCCCLEARRRPQPWSILCRDCQALGWTHFRRRRECSEHICEQGAVESGGASCPEVRWEWQCYDLWYPISDINCIWSWEQMNNHE